MWVQALCQDCKAVELALNLLIHQGTLCCCHPTHLAILLLFSLPTVMETLRVIFSLPLSFLLSYLKQFQPCYEPKVSHWSIAFFLNHKINNSQKMKARSLDKWLCPRRAQFQAVFFLMRVSIRAQLSLFLHSFHFLILFLRWWGYLKALELLNPSSRNGFCQLIDEYRHEFIPKHSKADFLKEIHFPICF